MTTRRFHSPADKVALLRRHLLEHVPVSDLCEEAGIAPSLFYLWQREFFENGQAAFSKPNGRHAKKAEEAKDQKIKALEVKLQRKDAVLGELMEEHVALKKELGEI
jgi:transposase-like protein